LVYEQFDDAVVASLLDGSGQGVGQSAYVDGASPPSERATHPQASRALLEAYAQNIPFELAQKSNTTVIGNPFWIEGSPAPILPVAIAIPGSANGRNWVVALGLSLRMLCDDLASASPHGVELLAVDRGGRQACPFAPNHPLDVLDDNLIRTASTPQPVSSTYLDRDKGEVLVAGVTLRSGWRILARQPVADAMAASRRLLHQTVLWIAISLAIALAAGILLGRSVSAPISQLVRGAGELARGNFSHRLRMPANDEFGELGEAFDRMGDQIAQRDAEIRGWNQDLQQRVEARTRELTEAHDQLLQSQKLAAVGALGAGVAHEINNPLTGVLGLSQVLLGQARTDPSRAKDVRLLENVEREALRIKGIVRRMLALSQGESRRDQAPIRLNGLLDATLRLLERETAASNLRVLREYASDLPAINGVFTQLQQALLQVFANAIAASGPDGRIVVTTRQVGDEFVSITIGDNGKGIPEELLERVFEPFFTTKEASVGKGLGLAIVHRVIENHHGTIKLDSTVGKGTTVTMSLPIGKGGPHSR
jgi:signal transduction histidine kinase